MCKEAWREEHVGFVAACEGEQAACVYLGKSNTSDDAYASPNAGPNSQPQHVTSLIPASVFSYEPLPTTMALTGNPSACNRRTVCNQMSGRFSGTNRPTHKITTSVSAMRLDVRNCVDRRAGVNTFKSHPRPHSCSSAHDPYPHVSILLSMCGVGTYTAGICS